MTKIIFKWKIQFPIIFVAQTENITVLLNYNELHQSDGQGNLYSLRAEVQGKINSTELEVHSERAYICQGH